MFRRIRYRKWLVAGLGLAALAAPSSALAGGSSSSHNMSSKAYQAMVARGRALNERYGDAVTGLSSKQFAELWKDGGSKLSAEALNEMLVLGQAMNEKYGTHNMPAAAYRALIAQSRALNTRYVDERYGAPDGWYRYAITLTRDHRAQSIADGRSPDTIDAAGTAQATSGFDPNSPATHARLVAQGYIDGSVDPVGQAPGLSPSAGPVDGRSPDTRDAAVQAHSPVVTITRNPGFQWGDFGIGTGVALGAVLLLALALRLLSNRQGRKPTPVATA
jgi:hypothetical protein